MASHVSQCMAHGKFYNMVWELFVKGGSNKKEKEGKKKREGKKGKKERKIKERERRRRKGEKKKEKNESGVLTVGTYQTKK